jgi:hypothetical protein
MAHLTTETGFASSGSWMLPSLGSLGSLVKREVFELRLL